LPPCSHDDVSHTKDQRVKHRGTQYNALKSWWKAQLAQIFLHGLSQLTQLITAAKTSASTEGSGKKTNLHPSGIIFKELEQSLTNDYYLVTYPGIVYGLGSHDHNGAWNTPGSPRLVFRICISRIRIWLPVALLEPWWVGVERYLTACQILSSAKLVVGAFLA